jgi:hypothetical protein
MSSLDGRGDMVSSLPRPLGRDWHRHRICNRL